jgi:hypothetical protein
MCGARCWGTPDIKGNRGTLGKATVGLIADSVRGYTTSEARSFLGGIEINDVHPPRVIGCLGLIMVGNRIPWHAGGISDSGVRSIALRRHSCSEHRLVWREACAAVL